ncbi:MAG: hypothetical protein R3F62_25210 [Planctomycetota bacterium]
MQLRFEHRSTSPRCALCHEGGRGLTACLGCGGLVHRGCRAEFGLAGCPTLGCAWTGPQVDALPQEGVPWRIVVPLAGLTLSPGVLGAWAWGTFAAGPSARSIWLSVGLPVYVLWVVLMALWIVRALWLELRDQLVSAT